MKPWRWIAALVCLVAFGGCRSSGNQEMLERELRFYEDKVDELNAVVREYEDQIESCQRENESLLAEAAGDGKKSRSRERNRPTPRSKRAADEDLPAPPDVSLPPGATERSGEQAPPFEGPPAIFPPDVEPGVEGRPPGAPADDRDRGSPPARLDLPDPGSASTDASASSDASAAVSEITLNRQLTGGHNTDNRPGDEGVLVVVEPRDASGELVDAPAEMSVVVLDPNLTGSAARVARWNFTAEDTAKKFERTALGAGFHFDLRWPHSPPINRSLQLYVRYVTADGRKLTAEKTILVDPPSPKPAGSLTGFSEPALLSAENEALPVESGGDSPAGPALVDPASDSGAPQWSPYR